MVAVNPHATFTVDPPRIYTARHFDDGRSQYFRSDVNPLSAIRVKDASIGCWFRKFSIPSGEQAFLYYGNAASDTEYMLFSLLPTSGFLNIFNRSGSTTRTTTINMCDGLWHSVQIEQYFSSVQRWRVYVDGVLEGATNEGSEWFEDLYTRVSFGLLDRPSQLFFFTGDVAHAWFAKARCLNKTLAIHEGRNLFDIFDQGDLVAYWPLWGIHTPEPNLVNGGLRALEFNGPCSTTTEGPNVQPLRRPLRVYPVAAAAGVEMDGSYFHEDIRTDFQPMRVVSY